MHKPIRATEPNKLVEIAKDTIDIFNKGFYINSIGKRIEASTDDSIDNTYLFSSEQLQEYLDSIRDARINHPDWFEHNTRIEVSSETTLQAAQRLTSEHPICLNFASATHPGGGFLRGARAQEESLARSSGLYYSLITSLDFYKAHQKSTGLYSDAMIHSPDVIVIKDDDGNLLDKPYSVDFLTVAAVNVGALQDSQPALLDQVHTVMKTRLRKILAVSWTMEAETLVLGAWGCGIFLNNTTDIANMFKNELNNLFKGAFKHVVFAVYDPAPTKDTLQTFSTILSQHYVCCCIDF